MSNQKTSDIKASRKFNHRLTKIWLLDRLLKGRETQHEDAIYGGFGHRLANSVFELRRSGFCEIIWTDFATRCYYIPPKKRKKARKLALAQGYLQKTAA